MFFLRTNVVWKKEIIIIIIVLGALRTVPLRLKDNSKDIGVDISIIIIITGSMTLHSRASILHGKVESMITIMTKNAHVYINTMARTKKESGMTLHAIFPRHTVQEPLLHFARSSKFETVISFKHFSVLTLYKILI